ncbi:MAG: hypothetical protein AAGD01_11925 [Acidobacteriota bacterium]
MPEASASGTALGSACAHRRVGAWSLALALILATLGVGTVGGCASSGEEEPQLELPSVPPTVAPPPVAERERINRRPVSEPLVPAVVEIDPDSDEDQGPRSLVEAAAAERQRRNQIQQRPGQGEQPKPKAATVITNKNLQEFASQGELTFVEEEDETEAQEPPELQRARTRSAAEEYWRDQALRVRVSLRDLDEERSQLEGRAAELRRRFYDEDDPYRRDGIVKPEWDRVLERLAETRQELRSGRLDLERLYEEAAAAGADASWLDEGLDLMPEDPQFQEVEDERREDRLPALEAIDPPSLETESTDPS